MVDKNKNLPTVMLFNYYEDVAHTLTLKSYRLHELCVYIDLLSLQYLQALPGQTASQEIHEHVSESLQVIPPTLFCTKAHQDVC